MPYAPSFVHTREKLRRREIERKWGIYNHPPSSYPCADGHDGYFCPSSYKMSVRKIKDGFSYSQQHITQKKKKKNAWMLVFAPVNEWYVHACECYALSILIYLLPADGYRCYYSTLFVHRENDINKDWCCWNAGHFIFHAFDETWEKSSLFHRSGWL